MLLPHLNRHLYVCGLNDVPQVLKRDPKFWNVISILEPTIPKPSFAQAKSHFRISFYDIENVEHSQGLRVPKTEDITQILGFVDSLPGEPILVHCRAGVSRSTAIILALIVRGYCACGEADCCQTAVEQLLELRPQAVPNALVLRLALESFMEPGAAIAMVNTLSNHPRLMENRFINPLRG